MIQLTNVSKKFGQRLAVDDLTLQVPARGDLRSARPQRRGQEHGDWHDAGAGLADGGEVKLCGYDVRRTGGRRCARSGRFSKARLFTIT